MKKLIVILTAVLCFSTSWAQQAQVEKRTKIPFAYKNFREADIEYAFGKGKPAKANIFLRDASLLYMKDTTVMKANLFGVISVNFGDAVYRKTDNRMGKVLASKGDILLTDVITIDVNKMRDDARSGKNSTFLDLPEFNIFVETNADYWGKEEANTYPLKDEYFFIVKGVAFPASEKIFKKHLREDKRDDFKELMKNRKWSWKDAESLKVLLDYL